MSSQRVEHAAARARSRCSATCRSISSRSFVDLLGVFELLEADHLLVAARREIAGFVEHVGDAAATCRPRSCGPSGPSTTTRPPVMYSQPWSPTPSTTAFDAAVAHAEALARHAAEIDFAGGRAVERDVADDDVLLGDEGRSRRRIDDDLAAGQALADVVVGIAFEREASCPCGMNAPKLWPAEPLNLQLDRVLGQALGAPAACVISLPVIVPTTRLTLRIGSSAVDLLAALDRRLAELEQRRDVERLLEAVILRRSVQKRPTSGPTSGWYRMLREVEALAPSSARWPCAARGDRRGRPFRRACGSRAAP